MPFYTFKCSTCDITKDELVKMGTETTVCKECGNETERLPVYRTVALGLPNGFHTIKSKSRRSD